ncbi:hypothetical protein KEM48_009919 [Puccinia striiformis f. sp. tritici PST-130]|nr:hypothetical protein KEM48_009919 [Puccinia striiformis f. sp. tritici PST-130]
MFAWEVGKWKKNIGYTEGYLGVQCYVVDVYDAMTFVIEDEVVLIKLIKAK